MGIFLSTCSYSKPSFLLFGANGWIGSKVYDLLVSMNYKVTKATSRANNHLAVEHEISTVNPTHVMSFIGRTHGNYDGQDISTIDYLEKPGKLVENIQDNLYAPITLASICKKLGCHFTYLGTGCIFNYDDLHPFYNEAKGFKESEEPNFFGSSYSIVKGYTDRLMHEHYNDTTLNIRIRMPITSEVSPRNFITKITNYDKICSVPNSMTVLDDLLPILIRYAIEGRTGTINLTNPGAITHNEILFMYKEIVDPTFGWTNFSIEEQDQILASKRSNNCLDTSTLENEINDIKPIKQAIKDVLYKMKKHIVVKEPVALKVEPEQEDVVVDQEDVEQQEEEDVVVVVEEESKEQQEEEVVEQQDVEQQDVEQQEEEEVVEQQDVVIEEESKEQQEEVVEEEQQ